MFRFATALLFTTGILYLVCPVSAQQTPPIAPKTVDTPLPTPIQIPAPPRPESVPNRPLTVEEAVLIALRRQPSILVAQSALAAAQGRTQQARSGLLPIITLDGSYTHVESLSSSSSSSGTSASGSTAGGSATTGSSSTQLGSGFDGTAGLRQLIFDFNHTRDLVHQSSALERAAFQDLTRVQLDLVFQVKQYYYQYIQAERLVNVNQGNVQNRQQQLDLARARLNSGLGLPSDVVTAETALAQATLDLNLAENTDINARIVLAQDMGIDPRTPIAVPDVDEPPYPATDMNALVETALRRRPEILEALANIDANHYGVNAARTTNAPSLSGNLQFQSRGDQFFPNDNTFSVGAAIQFPIYDGGLTQGKVKEAKANLTASQATLITNQQQVITDVSQAYLNLKSGEQRVGQADAEVANAAEGVRIATGRYRSGLGQFQDILTAQQFLLTAQTDHVNAVSAVDIARSALQHAIGSPISTAVK